MNNNFNVRAMSRFLPSTTTGCGSPAARMRLAFAMAFVSCLVFLPKASAQLYMGSIAGSVTDPSGTVVAGAQIQAPDEAKGYSFTATTDGGGRYTIRQLPPAKYAVTASVAGFKTQRKDGVTIDVNQQVHQ